MDEATQQNTALVEENAATSKTLEHQAKVMDERIALFRTGQVAEPKREARKQRAPRCSRVKPFRARRAQAVAGCPVQATGKYNGGGPNRTSARIIDDGQQRPGMAGVLRPHLVRHSRFHKQSLADG